MSVGILNQRGFTLLELVIVVLIVSLSTAVVYVSISISERKALLRDTARRLYVNLRYAREKAVIERIPVGLIIDETGKAYSIVQIKDELMEDHTMVRHTTVRDNIRVDGESIIFYPIGNSTGGTLRISDNENREVTITVDSATGVIKIEKG